MKLTYPVVFIPWENESGYTIEVPDLPGCVSQGETLAEAIEMAVDAASGWILGELEDGNSFPGPSQVNEIDLRNYDEGSFVSLVLLDMEAYAEKYGDKAVCKNITIPAWLNTYGEKNAINFSKVLTEALLQRASN